MIQPVLNTLSQKLAVSAVRLIRQNASDTCQLTIARVRKKNNPDVGFLDNLRRIYSARAILKIAGRAASITLNPFWKLRSVKMGCEENTYYKIPLCAGKISQAKLVNNL
jgi:uncharacterized protein YlxP (DUF503 family)